MSRLKNQFNLNSALASLAISLIVYSLKQINETHSTVVELRTHQRDMDERLAKVEDQVDYLEKRSK